MTCDPLHNLTAEQADLALLVLRSQGLSAEVSSRADGRLDLVVDPEDEERARQTLQQYAEENSMGRREPPVLSYPSRKGVCLVSVLVLSLVHAAWMAAGEPRSIIQAYGASALYILQGDHYRVITALMLHASVGHLAGNIAGILIFGIPVCGLNGSGRGLLLLLGSGALGNLMNAAFYRTARLSIGASTSVMGAAGVLVAFQVIRRGRVYGLRYGIFAPMAAGIAIVAMLSGGERTDVMAHLFGFLAGIGCGALTAWFPEEVTSAGTRDRMQLLIAVGIIISAWLKLF